MSYSPWCQEGSRIRLSFDPIGKIEALCRVDFAPNQNLTGDEEIFPDFDTERIALVYVTEMMKAAILQLRMTMLDGVRNAAEISSLERKLILVQGGKGIVGSLEREKKNLQIMMLNRNGVVTVMKSPYTNIGGYCGPTDYGEPL